MVKDDKQSSHKPDEIKIIISAMQIIANFSIHNGVIECYRIAIGKIK
jgi:hypothetical protein